MADSQYGAPQSSGGGGVGGWLAENPWAKWVGLGAVALGAYWFVRRRQAAAPQATTGSGSTDTTSSIGGGGSLGGTVTDIGQIGSTSGDLASWTNSAIRALGSATYDPLQVENAIYRFTNGLTLDATQQGIISKVIGVIGNPPGGPFGVLPPIAPPSPVVAPAQGRTLNPATWLWRIWGPPTVAVGTQLLTGIGFLGSGPIKTPPMGSTIYAKVKNKAGNFIWTRVNTLTQYAQLPKGTQIAYLTGSGATVAHAAA